MAETTEHGDQCFPCEDCLNERLDESFNLGTENGIDKALQIVNRRLLAEASDAFILHEEGRARRMRALYESLSGELKRASEAEREAQDQTHSGD